jgi:kynurenine formamidase
VVQLRVPRRSAHSSIFAMNACIHCYTSNREDAHMRHAPFLPTASVLLLAMACSPGADTAKPVSGMQIVDLTHDFDENTVYWPTDTRGFQLERLASGRTEGGFFYSANAFCTAEHGGTHIDAPIHFFEDGLAVNEVPLENLVRAAVVIDVSKEAASNPDYRLTLAAVEAHEARHGVIPQGAIVLLRTGWSAHWPDVRAYLGDDTPGDASKLSFPSYGEEAAQYLIDARGVPALGVDTASIDYGRSTDFAVHRIAAAKQVVGLENLTNLEALPVADFTVIALPMKIAGGSGGPVRVIAMLESG